MFRVFYGFFVLVVVYEEVIVVLLVLGFELGRF